MQSAADELLSTLGLSQKRAVGEKAEVAIDFDFANDRCLTDSNGEISSMWTDTDKTLLFRRRNIVESFLYVKKKWGTIYGVLGMRYGRKGCEWLQKEGSRCDQLLN